VPRPDVLIRAANARILNAGMKSSVGFFILFFASTGARLFATDPVPSKTIIVHVQDSDGSPLPGASAKAEGADISASVTTGSDGSATIPLPAARPQYLAVRIQKDGFVPKLIDWSLDQPSFILPSDFTVKMEKAHSIGGVVKNDEGEPVEGARVVLIIRGSSMGGMALQVFNDIWERRVTTDKEGKWHFDEAPSDLRSLSVTLEHPDYVSNERFASRPGDDEFKKRTALLILHKGIPVDGNVTDEKGEPISGVDVTFGESGSDSTSYPTARTDAGGHFHFGGLSIKKIFNDAPILTFSSPNYAPEMVELQNTSTAQALKVQLRPGKRLQVRFTDKQGQPAKDVTLCADHWRGHRPFGSIRFQSDNDGRIVWDHAPGDPITYALLSDTFQNQDLILQPKNEAQTVQLKRPTVVSGRVLDATTKQSITDYNLISGTYFPEKHPFWSSWARGAALHIKADFYRYVFSGPARMGSPDGSGTEGFHRIRIEAPGYEPAVSRPIANDEESVSIDFQLRPATAIHGVVKADDGTPVKNAQLVVAGPGNALQIINGVCQSKWDQLTVNTNDQGEYELPPQEEDFPIAIIQPEAGYFTTTYSALKTAPNVKLLPWGEINLATTAQNDAKPRYYVRYAREDEASYQKERIHFEVYEPSGFQNGMVIFKQLVAGPLRIGKFGGAINEGQVVQVENGKTTHVDLKTGKNAVIGRISMPPGASADSPLTILRLRPVVPDPPYPPNFTKDKDQRRAWVQKWITTPEGKAYEARAGEIPFTLDARGNFRIDDVSPGSYQLIAVFLRSLPSGPEAKADVLGAVQRKFEFTNATADYDLGTLPVQTDVH